MANNKNRPIFLDLKRIHMPVNAVMSIGHRLAGVMLFLAIPVAIYILELSLQDSEGYQQVQALFDGLLFRAIFILILWFLAHHFLAGIRYLLIDVEVGVEPAAARKSAWWVIISAVVAVLIFTQVLI